MRLPKCRRPRERSWEFANVRSFGLKEGGQNYRIWGLCLIIVTSILAMEGRKQWHRILARGDTCPACESAREHYRQRLREKEGLVDPLMFADRQHAAASGEPSSAKVNLNVTVVP